MPPDIDHSTLHRTAKYFMDNGRAESPEAAVGMLRAFGLTILAGAEVAHSAGHQTALLTLVNVASRTLLGGVEVVGLPDVPSASALAPGRSLEAAVRELGGTPVSHPAPHWPCAVVGTSGHGAGVPAWQLTWGGWRGGAILLRENARLEEDDGNPLAPALAAACCAAEAFAFHAGDHPMAGRRSSGLSLWRPGAEWQSPDATEPRVAYLPSRLWIIGLGNLGQAFAWLLGCLPYAADAPPLLVLQDFDAVTPANESTSLLTSPRDVRRKKTRVVADWLEARGFSTVIEERRFGPWTQRTPEEPGAALCGVDNALARAALEQAGFGLVVEAGLGAGPQGFRSIFLHTFPASRAAADIWSAPGRSAAGVEHMPAYEALRRGGMDGCGLAQLASRTVAVPFVSLTAGCLVVSELLRRLHAGPATELASLSMLSLADVEAVALQAPPYAFGHVPVSPPAAAPPVAMPPDHVHRADAENSTTPAANRDAGADAPHVQATKSIELPSSLV
jgi:hypothetical protein